MVSYEVLQAHMEQYGAVAETWIPWRPNDQRPFGFVTFEMADTAQRAVAASLLLIGTVQVTCALKRPATVAAGAGRPKDKDAGQQGVQDSELLRPLPPEEGGPVTWADYLAPASLKEALASLAEGLDPDHAERLRRSSSTRYRIKR